MFFFACLFLFVFVFEILLTTQLVLLKRVCWTRSLKLCLKIKFRISLLRRSWKCHSILAVYNARSSKHGLLFLSPAFNTFIYSHFMASLLPSHLLSTVSIAVSAGLQGSSSHINERMLLPKWFHLILSCPWFHWPDSQLPRQK